MADIFNSGPVHSNSGPLVRSGEIMKSSILRTGLALACAVSLASCGGGNTGTLVLGGYISGVTMPGLVLQNNGGSDLAIAAGATSFQFTDLVPTDAIYNVTVKAGTIPSNVQSCSVTNGSGNTGVYSVTSVTVTCIIFTHALGGSVSGLTTDGLVLLNGTDKVTVPANATSFAMAPVSQGYPFGITVYQQPAGLTCSIANGVGTQGTTDNNGVAVTCTPNT
jgi:hypothetical protein